MARSSFLRNWRRRLKGGTPVPVSPIKKSPLANYFLALLVTTGGLGLKLVIDSAGPTHMPLLLNTVVVFFALVFAGIIPALLSLTLMALATAYYFLEPIGSFSVSKASDIYGLFFSILEGLLLITFAGPILDRVRDKQQSESNRIALPSLRWIPYATAILLGAVSVAIVSSFPRQIINHFSETSQWIDHSFRVRNELRNLLLMYRNAEFEASEFVRQPNEKNRKELRQLAMQLPHQVERVEALMLSHPDQVARLKKLRSDTIELANAIDGKLQKGNDLPVSDVRNSAEDLYQQTINIFDFETKLIEKHQEESNRTIERAATMAAAVTAISTSVIIGILLLLLWDARRRLKLERELLLARQMAETANRAKSDFLANMSHEIRTPINGITGLVSLLKGTELNSAQTKYLSGIEKSAGTLLAVINDVLDFSKIEAGKLDLESINFNLKNLIEDLKDIFLPLFEAKGLRFSIIAPDASGLFFGDEGRIRQVLNNLLSNALKFTDSGAVTLQVVVSPGEDDKFELHFSITDTGIGVSEAVQQKLFQPFSQADATTARRFGGSGLGLAISKKLVEKMGGRITVRSKENQGSTFDFFVTVKPSLESRKPDSEELPLITLKREVRRRFNVLIVEDNEINREITHAILEKAGYMTLIASDGGEAVEVCSTQKVDIVLMDCHMPIVDGYEATTQLRQMGFQAPIIALTAKAFTEDQKKCLSLGMNDFLSKPVTEERLIQMVDSHLGRKEMKSFKPVLSDQKINQVLDSSYIERLVHLDPSNSRQLVPRLVSMYLENVDSDLIKIKEAAKKAGPEFKFLVHRLKSSTANLGGTRAAQILEDLEDRGIEARYNIITDLESEILKFKTALKEFPKLTAYNKMEGALEI